jgi:hypothetical protein
MRTMHVSRPHLGSSSPLLALSAALALVACGDDGGTPSAPAEAPIESPVDAGATELDGAEDASTGSETDAASGAGGLPSGALTPADDPFADDGSVSGFRQPILVCSDPLPGEPPGQTDGKVCTWSLISACTEEGRRFIDYSSCDEVVTQRPYTPYAVEVTAVEDDSRLDDDVWQAEQAWVASQVESCACVCCHSTEAAPRGPSGWYIEAGPLWVDTIPDDGLAMLAGLVPSDAFGWFEPEQNNGFDRRHTGLPTTDVERMSAFFLEEYARRGYEVEDAERIPPFGGPLPIQLGYTPEPCTPGRGVNADGSIVLGSGRIRYLYVLEAGSANPGVPPNLDTPEGTLWRIDVPRGGRALGGPFQYGEVPDGMVQRIPADGSPPPTLVPGQTYYVYSLIDVGVPQLRCLATIAP